MKTSTFAALMFAFIPSVFATTLPTNQELQVASEGAPVDPALAQWFRTYAEAESPLDLKASGFEQYLKNQDQVTAAFLKLRYASAQGRNEKPALDLTRETLKLLQEKTTNDTLTSHPLYPYLLQEVIESSKASHPEVAFAYESLDKFGDRSCPRKDYFLKDLTDKMARGGDADALNAQLDRMLYFKAPRFRRESLEVFLDGLAEDKQGAFRDRLLPVVREFPKLLEDNAWLLGDDEATAMELGIKEPFKSLRAVAQNSARKKCRTAKLDFQDLLEKNKGQSKYFDRFEQTALKLEECFQRKGQSARETYWAQMEAPLQVAFGFRGKELARRKLALLKWARDDFTSARRLFNEIADEAAKVNEPAVEANALYTLARIEENDSKIPASLAYYRKYADKFPESDRFLDAEMAMVLLNYVMKDYKNALTSAEAIVNAQAKLSLDKRNTGALAFALFWAGRLQFNLGDKKMAREMWERVANEYYSTFYGAIGHFMIEKLDGKALVLSPSRTSPFDPQQLYGKFESSEQPTVQRVLALLKIGLRDEASCELSELVVRDSENERLLAKALFQYAAGEWLASIKNFDALPRSFRNGLSAGFERLLFPRAYEQSVHDYSKRINMDPDLIFAIIRQESVFNPRANSAAGARGLMQLMPGTARVEAKRLGLTYVDKADRKKFKHTADNADSLFDADMNIAIGVHHVWRLLEKYQNPVYVLTSYNANPRATERWKQNLPTEDFLSFIERIPYAETRTYVKLVLRNYFYYKRWYRSPEPGMRHLDNIAKNVLVVAGKPDAAVTK